MDLLTPDGESGGNERNAEAIGRADKLRAAEVEAAFWELFADRARPVLISEKLATAAQLAQRFDAPHRRPDDFAKIRVTDDLRASAVADILPMRDTAAPDSSGAFFATAAYFRTFMTECELHAAPVNFFNSYRAYVFALGRRASRQRSYVRLRARS